MRKFSLNRKNEKDNNEEEIRESEAYVGTVQDLLKRRAKDFDKNITQIEEVINKDYTGGGLVLVLNTYDENNKVTGHRVLILGSDDLEGTLHLAHGAEKASKEVVETVINSFGQAETAKFIVDLLKNKKGM